jgi:ABC-type amino acid transport substrate-binding protein/two-component sensor histidine kinase
MGCFRAVFVRVARTLSAALVVMLLCCLIRVVEARADLVELTPEEKAFVAAHPVITFSDSDWRPLSIVVGGRSQGLFHDYFTLISQRTGLAFRFEPQGDGRDFQLVLDALRERRIDMIDGTGKTPDRARYALFVGPYLRFPLAIMSREDTPVSSLEALAGRRVAVGRGGTAHEYLKEHDKNLTIIPAEDHTEALRLVATGRADAAVENLAVAAHAIRMAGLVNVKISGLLDYSFEIYSLVRSDWPLLASILKKAQDSVTETERGALLAKWLPVYKERLEGEATRHEPAIPGIGAAVALTDREREYLNHKKALAYCIDPDWAPIEHIDENGRHVGMTADFLELMSARLGAPMVLVPTPSWSQTLVAIKDGRCDFLPAAGDTRQRRRFLNFTSSYLRFPMVVATLAKVGFIDDPSALVGKSLGVINGYASLDILRAKYPDLQLLEVPSVTEGLRLVSEGKLFGFIDIVPVISQAIAKGHFSDLKIAGRLDAHLDLSLASREDEPELNSLFQKAVNSLTKAEIDAITKKWLAVTFEQGFDYALLWKVLAGGSAVLFVVIWWNRKLARLNRTIRRAHEALDQTSRRLGALLDNAGQGFLTVDADGLVEPQYSQECRTIFGVAMAGVWLPEVLYPTDLPARELMAKNIRRILDEPDAYRRELYLSLMPKTVRRGGATLRLAYRALAGARLMFVITDVSGEVELRDAVARERNRLACVVAAVRDERDFFAVLDAFALFREQGAREVREAPGGRQALEQVYRRVHTFKGLFLQFECAQAAKALDALESRLSTLRRTPEPTRESVADALGDTAVDVAVAGDVDVVRQALGEEFFSRRDTVSIDDDVAKALSDLCDRLLARSDALGLDAADQAVLRAGRTMRFVDMRRLLAGYPREAQRLARSQGKELAPFPITGDPVLVDPHRFDPLVKSLIHLFRNAVDHGLEMPQQREERGKSPVGRLECRVIREGDWLTITVRDDGRGVDPASLRSRAFELGLGGAEELAALDDAASFALVFRDGFTTRREAGDLSGRGVGLAAVRAEAERLGGNVTMESTPGQGTCLHLAIPLGPAGVTSEDA